MTNYPAPVGRSWLLAGEPPLLPSGGALWSRRNHRLIGAGLALLLLALSGCAAAISESRSLNTLSALQLRIRAGLYAGDWSVSGDSHKAQMDRLLQWAHDQGIIVAPAPIESKNLLGHASYTNLAGWIVLLNDRLSVNSRLYILLHELGHVYSPGSVETREQAETIAMFVAAQVCEDIGLQVWPQTAAYLVAQVPPEQQAATVQRYGSTIDQIVAMLSKAAKGS